MHYFNFKRLGLVFFSFLYSSFLVMLPNDYFRDRVGYIVYAEESSDYFYNSSQDGFLSLFFSDPIFLKLNSFFSIFFSSDLVPKVFVFFSGFIFFYCFMRESKGGLAKFFILLLLLLTPGFFHLQNVVLRQGLCSAILILVCVHCDDKRKWILASFILGMIHSSFFLITFFLFFEYLFTTLKFKRTNAYILTSVVSIVVALSYIFIGKYLGVRQSSSDYLAAEVSVSGFAFIMWLSVFILILIRKKTDGNYKIDDVSIMGLIIYLSMYFISPIGGRLILSFIPFFFISMVRRVNLLSFVFIIFFLAVNAYIFRSTISENSLNFVIPAFF